jgi:hypothetical protein
MSSSAKALRVDPHDPQPNLTAPLGEVPVARPGFRRSMTFLVLLSVPLWAALVGAGFLVARLLG